MSLNDRSQESQMNWFTQARNFFARSWSLLTEAHSSITDIGERRQVQLLSGLSLILTVAFVLGILSNPTALATFILFLTLAVVAYLISRTRFYYIAAYLFSFGFTSVAYITLYTGTANSIDSSISNIVPISLILASAILSQRGFVVLVIATAVATFLSFTDLFVDPKYLADPSLSLGRTVGTTTFLGLVLLGITIFRTNVERARLKEIQGINAELEDLTSNLEQRVDERTVALEQANRQTSKRASQLQAITQLSESIADFKNLNELFPSVAKLISERFGFYHVGIFLIDKDKNYAILQAANSEGGQRMLDRNHRLELGVGVVGFAAQSGQPRIALDVGSDAFYFNNPDLPETHSEAALPMKSRGEIIGVLDVQSTETGAFSVEDLQVLTALANQVSIAFENTRLLTETRAALKQSQEVYNEFTRTEWTRAISIAEQPGFRYQAGRIEILENELDLPEVVSAVQQGQVVTAPANGSEEKRPTLAVPVQLRGEVIGVLHIEAEDQSRTWNRDEISLVEAIAERAAIAMENARLFQDARRRASKEQLISEASAKIGNAINLENILETTAVELERVLGGSEVVIQFKNKEAQS